MTVDVERGYEPVGRRADRPRLASDVGAQPHADLEVLPNAFDYKLTGGTADHNGSDAFDPLNWSQPAQAGPEQPAQPAPKRDVNRHVSAHQQPARNGDGLQPRKNAPEKGNARDVAEKQVAEPASL